VWLFSLPVCLPCLSQEVINLLRSPYAHKPLSQLHPHPAAGQPSHDDNSIVPYEKACELRTALVGWLTRTGSEYSSAITKRQMNTSHINQVPMLAAPITPAEVTWTAGELNTLSLPAGTFLDVDDDTLVFSGSLDRGALPDWLRVHPKDGSVHGKPPSKGSSHLLRVTAADGKVGSAFLELHISVE
jgi:hypothetical protein